MSYLVITLGVIFVKREILKILGFNDKAECIITLKLVILILPLFTTSKTWKTVKFFCPPLPRPGHVPIFIKMLLERPNSSHVPDVTKTGILSSICVQCSFSKRKLTKIALEISESLIGFPAAFEDCFALTKICTCSVFVITGHALGPV